MTKRSQGKAQRPRHTEIRGGDNNAMLKSLCRATVVGFVSLVPAIIVLVAHQWIWILFVQIPAILIAELVIERYQSSHQPKEIDGTALPSDLSTGLASTMVELGFRSLDADYALAHTQLERLLGILQVDGVLLAGIVAGVVTLVGDKKLNPGSSTLLLGSAGLLILSTLLCVYGMRTVTYGAFPAPGTMDKGTRVREVATDMEKHREAATYVALVQTLRTATVKNIAVMAARRTTIQLAVVCLVLGLLVGAAAGLFTSIGAAGSSPSVGQSPSIAPTSTATPTTPATGSPRP